ncbi:mechanosensitive ion channel protein 2, chloroplastic-like [Aristolochia californica]|uniref:mechanosensitive ion channel protein 2, chloroplastic-like n=1 Tax=Aristolochia californica TaxID=171875 RepID=UPI0035DC8A2B
MAIIGSLQLSHELGICEKYGGHWCSNPFKRFPKKDHIHFHSISLSSKSLRQDMWSLWLSDKINKPIHCVPLRYNVLTCKCFLAPGRGNETPILKAAAMALSRSYTALHGRPILLQLVPAVGIIAFAIWGLAPLIRHCRNLFFQKNDSNWKKSSTYHVTTSYIQPLLLWTGATLICRVLDPVILPTEASQVVKQRLLNFVRSLSTVLAFAYCLSSLIQHAQKFFVEGSDSHDSRNMGFQFAGKAMYTAVWVAAVSLFMELLGFSTQKWITAGGLGTVLLTLAGREIFTNFLSSVMIHATRPFVVNEWIQTKIEGYEVSGTVEHVGWWSPTIVRGDDREAVHIPNHKFTVNVVRNLSQKTHWRIKTHLAISHLDVNKINNIVADMRKVLAKNHQVEQQRLHRRVFLENINPDNQALLILVSCFVKTSHFEEYLCVKEAILLDLLRVISHHRARLATPIRTVQKIYADADVENIPETVFTHGGATTSRPFLLIEPTSRIKGDDKAKARARASEEQERKTVATSEMKATTPVSDGSIQYSSENKQNKKSSSGETHTKTVKVDSSAQTFKSLSESHDAKDGIPRGAAFEKPSVAVSDASNIKSESNTKHDSERLPTTSPLEENIVLGVALEGSKRTLPIEEEMTPSTSADGKELTAYRNTKTAASTKEKKEGQIPVAGDQRDHDR